MKKRFNVTIDEDLIVEIDNLADKLGQSRSAFLSMAAATYIQQTNTMQNLPRLLTDFEKSMEQERASK